MPDTPLEDVELLLTTFPELRAHERRESRYGETYPVFELPALPEADACSGLIVDLGNGEITIGFDAYHTHFSSWIEGEESGTEPWGAIPLLRQILADEVEIRSYWSGERCLGSRCVDVGGESPPTEIRGYDRIRIRSWRGTRKADLHGTSEPG